MILELFGLPAVGKSSLARELAKIENIENVKIRSIPELFLYNFLFFIKNPLRFFVLLNFTLVNLRPKRLAYYKFVNTFLQHNAKYEKARKYEIGVIDQGHSQNFLSLFEHELSDEQIKLYYKILPKSDLLIVVEVSEKERQKRLAGRDYGVRRFIGEEYFHNWESVIKENFNKLREFLTNDKKALFIDGEDDLERNVRKIIKEINL